MGFWLCGQYKSGDTGSAVWEFQGIFSTGLRFVVAVGNASFTVIYE